MQAVCMAAEDLNLGSLAPEPSPCTRGGLGLQAPLPRPPAPPQSVLFPPQIPRCWAGAAHRRGPGSAARSRIRRQPIRGRPRRAAGGLRLWGAQHVALLLHDRGSQRQARAQALSGVAQGSEGEVPVGAACFLASSTLQSTGPGCSCQHSLFVPTTPLHARGPGSPAPRLCISTPPSVAPQALFRPLQDCLVQHPCSGCAL